MVPNNIALFLITIDKTVRSESNNKNDLPLLGLISEIVEYFVEKQLNVLVEPFVKTEKPSYYV